MRKLPIAVLVSVAAHGAAIAFVPGNLAKPKAVIPPVSPASERAAPPEPEIVAVELLDDHTAAQAVSGTGDLSHAASRPGSRHISTGRPGTTHETGKAPADKPRSKLMTMRHPELNNGPSAEFWERFERNTKPLQPKDIASEQLEDDLKNDRDNLKNPAWVANASADELAGARFKLLGDMERREAEELQPDGTGYKSKHEQFTVHTEADGRAHFEDARNLQIHGLSGTFDIGDAIMRDHGMDPYASAKRKWLDTTRDERAAIATKHERLELAQSAKLMQKNVERLFARTTDVAARKQGLFELWDDCAETGDAARVAGGRAAREYVVGVIRTELPPGSASAYTPDELARLNAHRAPGSTPFAPYE